MKATIYGLSLLSSVVLSGATPFSHSVVDEAPLVSSSNAKEIPNSYIIVFKKHVKHADAAKHHDWVHNLHINTQETKMELRKRSHIPTTDEIFAGLKHTYNVAGQLLGYAGHFDEDVISEVRRHPDVSSLAHSPRYPRELRHVQLSTDQLAAPDGLCQPPDLIPCLKHLNGNRTRDRSQIRR